MNPLMIYFLLLGNCGLVIRGFSLRSCFLSADNRAFCALHSLSSMPPDIPPTVRGIDLSNNDISTIHVSNFTSFPNLTSLDLKQNHISCIGRRSFSHLVSLQQLTLSRNKLIELEDDVFDGLPTLLKLRLDFNQIQRVAENAFRSLNSLVLLELSYNKLQTVALVHLAVQHMPQLRDLMISNNGISTFRSQDLTNISTKLTSLSVSENPLVMFEVTADVFPQLRNLSIGNPTVKSNLTWSVEKRGLLRHVTILDISAVQLASMDEWRKLLATFISSLSFLKMDSSFRPSVLINISCSIPTLSMLQVKRSNLLVSSGLFQMCRNITTLDLTDNAMRRIGKGSLNFLHRLQVLILSNNLFQFVPSAVRYLASLTTLDLASNQIKTLGCQDFTGLTSLTELRLQRNKITALNNCTFANLSKLEGLMLHGNLILDLGSAFQSSLPNLKYLSLDQNKLTMINKNDFKGLCSLTKLTLSKNQIFTLEKGCFSGLTSLNVLQLHNNELKTDSLRNNVFNDLLSLGKLHLENNHINYGHSSPVKDPPFMNLSRLEILIFQRQTWQSTQGHIPSNFLQGLTSLLTFSGNNLQIFNFSDNFFTYTPRLTNLDISYNSLQDLTPKLFAPITNLTRLRVSSNNLRSLDFLINANLTKLQYLKARKTPFSVISEDIIKSIPSILELDLKQNSFTCDCDNSWFVQWIKRNNQTQVQGAHSFRCNYPPKRKNTRLLDLNVQSCVVDIGFICFICSACVTVLILVASFTFHFSRFHLKYAYYLFLAWLYDSRNRQKRAACQYDAFVSYNAHNEAWVYRELVPRLEQDQGWRLCLHHRDFLPGKPIVENIAEAIYGSRKTLCVISRRYLQSEWCSKEMQLASFRLFDEREDVLILVFLEDIPSSHMSPYYRMKRLLKRRSYLSWPRAAQHPQLFWEKLRQALRSTNSEEEDRLRLTVTH